ncbi:MAG: cbb3-type cytochrome c oxidase subunit 3 [Burkholderiales bacterium]|nr:cbb3-type cytochrome c oxidase subunit 3 [Burkholderiales bacterium]
MSALWGHFVGVFIVLMMATFIGIWIWAWLPRHKHTFGRLARMPMQDGAAGVNDPIPSVAEVERR